MQSSLPFTRITAEEAATARRVEFERPRSPQPPAVPKRPVGRPRSKRPLVLDSEATAAAAAADGDAPVAKKHRQNWFSSPYINDILRAFQRSGGRARTAVHLLQKGAPDDRFSSLSHTTLLSWHEKGTQVLLPRFQEQYDAYTAAARGRGPTAAFAAAPKVEAEIVRTLTRLRAAGSPVNRRTVAWVMHAIIEQRRPELLETLTLSRSFITRWVRSKLQWSWRQKTTAASKLPLDWEDQGVKMAMRIAALMGRYKVHPSLVINMDQTGVQLVPMSGWTYEQRGAAAVEVLGADDKRQITACIASSLDGTFLPLQLIFQGKTPRCLPNETLGSLAANFHLTFSENHWSNQKTMQEYVENVIVKYANRCVDKHGLHADAKIILVLDVWAVHKSEEFRRYLRTHHPRIHLVFVPANCTSRLQVADVALQRPFKSSIRTMFDEWACTEFKKVLESEDMQTFAELLKMSTLKPKILDWCVEAWRGMVERKELILTGWIHCCTSLFNVQDPEKRCEAMAAVQNSELEETHIPNEEEQEFDAESQSEPEQESDNESDDERDFSIPIPEGKRTGRVRKPPEFLSPSMGKAAGCRLNPCALAMEVSGEEPDSDANGLAR